MEWKELIIDGYGRILENLGEALNGLTQDDLNQQPHPDCNSMGWLAWHLTRVLDHEIGNLMGGEQLWISDQWYKKFNRAPDASDAGFGHSSEEVAAFRSPDVGILLDYHRAVLARTKSYISDLSPAELDRKLDEPWFQPLPTVGVRLVSVMSDGLQHAGQIAYLRGLLKGKGWLGY
ncbi:DinB family protein [Chloroflexota bacterium]